MVLAPVPFLVTWRLMRCVRICEAIRKGKILPSVSVRVRDSVLQAFSAVSLCSQRSLGFSAPGGH